MKKNNLIALIIVSVLAIGIMLWKSGVFAKSGKKESEETDNGGSSSSYGYTAVPNIQSGAASVDYDETARPSVSGLSISRIPRSDSYDSHITTLNSPEMIAVNYGKQKR